MGAFRKKLRGIFSIRSHLIMCLDLMQLPQPNTLRQFNLYKVEHDTELIDGTYSVQMQQNIISHNPGLVETFVLKDKSETIGIMSVMYKGGNELEYKIRNIDAFVYNVLIRPEFRGNGYAGVMFILLSEYLKKKDIDKLYLAVSKDNYGAISAYKKIGFSITGEKLFVRALRHNIPYYVL